MRVNTQDNLDIVCQIANNFFSNVNTFSIKILGEGDCNINYLIENSTPKIVVKLSKSHREYKALEEYKKEEWCIKKVQKLGIPTPKILEVNQYSGRAYQIQSYVEGTPGANLKGVSSFSEDVKIKVWQKLGEYTKKINSIQVTGWGENLLDETGKFIDSWKKYIGYNINSLKKDDELIKMGVLSEKTSNSAKLIFQSLLDKNFTFGLCHNDIALRNTIIDSEGKIYLLDWGTARAEFTPHCDLNEILSSSKPNKKTLQAFLDGYGMSLQEFELMRTELEALKLLNVIDTLRWAIDKKPENLEEYLSNAKASVTKLVKEL